VTGEDQAEALSRAHTDLAAVTAHSAELQRALLSGRQIGMAMVILTERHRITGEQAFDQLRTLSQQSNVTLRDVAERLVYTGDAGQRHD